MKMFKKSEGFTLVELMVVVLIIGILVAIAIPVFNAAKTNAQRKSCWANQRTIEGAVQTMAADGTGLVVASTSATLVSNGYLKTNPKCPLATAAGYGYDASGTVAPPTPDCTHGYFQ